MSDEIKCDVPPGADVSVTANAAEFEMPNGISVLGIFHVRCDCQPTAALAAPIDFETMTAKCRFCGMVYKVEELSVTFCIHADNINGVPVATGSDQVN